MESVGLERTAEEAKIRTTSNEVVVKKFKILKNGKIVESETPGKYAGWKKGKIFGKLDCKSGTRMKKENRVFFLDYGDALNEGYLPCKKCKPTPN